jgi:PhoPQ-activated pathogenicity-related protein
MNLTLQEILDDLHAAELELQNYEKKYKLRSEAFYDYFTAGVIEDEGNPDFQSWAGIFEIKRDLEGRYKERLWLQKPFRDGIKAVMVANGLDVE